jgi:hypothetical protein
MEKIKIKIKIFFTSEIPLINPRVELKFILK